MPDLSQPIRLAFIGGHGHHYLRPLAESEPYIAPGLPGVRVEALAVASDGHDPSATRAKFAKLLAGGATWYDSPEAMVVDFRPTLVNVGAVYAHAGPINAMLIERGIATVSDKPVAATWDDLRRVEAACSASEAPLITEFDFRCRATFRAARAAVRRGDLGTPVLAVAQKSYRFGDARPAFYARRADYGSTLLWIASHGIDALTYVTGRRLTRVAARHGNLALPEYPGMEDHCTATFETDNGGTGVVHADFLRPAAAPTHGDDRFRLVGSEGQVEIIDGRCTLTTHTAASRDITDEAEGEPPHMAMLRAALHGATEHFGTAASLAAARGLLAARDAADSGEARDIPRGEVTLC